MAGSRQPFLHHLVNAVAAPTTVLSAADGDIGWREQSVARSDDSADTAPSASAQGVWHADARMLQTVRLLVDGAAPEPLAHAIEPFGARFTAVSRQGHHPFAGDQALRVDRLRRVQPGRLTESVQVTNPTDQDLVVAVTISLASDFATLAGVRRGTSPGLTPLTDRSAWQQGPASVHVVDTDAALHPAPDGCHLHLDWDLSVPAGGTSAVTWSARFTDAGGAVVAAPPDLRSDTRTSPDSADPVLTRWLAQSLADLAGLRMCLAGQPEDAFFAAGSPWYFTLFGRDSVWTSRLLLPLDVGQAGGTLRALARLQGHRIDRETGEEPGKIIHELRRDDSPSTDLLLPPRYYGTIDATPLWICLLHDAWRAGLPEAEVAELLPNLVAALAWLDEHGDADGDGFLEYAAPSGRGLANQGWKDSPDAVRWADGRIATGPIALCEVQGYAYEAARGGADLLDHFGREGADHWRAWAAELASRFRKQFWCGTGADRRPALALDGSKRPVDGVTSNIGHLLGTGILSTEEEALVARRVTAPDLDSGLGLRTLAASSGGYDPLSYHCGSVWPHDTAIVIDGLHRSGHGHLADSLADGLLAAAGRFDFRLPELWSGEGPPGVPFPTACRPQAWSAVAAVTVASHRHPHTRRDRGSSIR